MKSVGRSTHNRLVHRLGPSGTLEGRRTAMGAGTHAMRPLSLYFEPNVQSDLQFLYLPVHYPASLPDDLKPIDVMYSFPASATAAFAASAKPQLVILYVPGILVLLPFVLR